MAVPRWFRERRERERKENKKRPTDSVITLELTGSSDEFEQAMQRWGVSIAEAGERMSQIAARFPTSREWESWVDIEDEWRKITSVEARQETIDVSTFGEFGLQTIPGRLDFYDQDGRLLPDELRDQFIKVYEREHGEVAPEVMAKILASWNGDTEAMEVEGHLDKCQYNGTMSFACTCQPPTLFGRTLRWPCECCEQPRATQPYRLCEMCESHEYASDMEQRLDHEAELV